MSAHVTSCAAAWSALRTPMSACVSASSARGSCSMLRVSTMRWSRDCGRSSPKRASCASHRNRLPGRPPPSPRLAGLDHWLLIEAQGPRGGTEVFVHAADRDGLFATITAIFDRLRLSVLDARVVTSRSGMSLDSFLVVDSEGHALTDAARIARLHRALGQALEQTPYRADLVARGLIAIAASFSDRNADRIQPAADKRPHPAGHGLRGSAGPSRRRGEGVSRTPHSRA